MNKVEEYKAVLDAQKKQGKEIEELIKEELDELKEFCAYGSCFNVMNDDDEHFIYSIRGCGFIISFYESRGLRRLMAGVECYVSTRYEIYGFTDLMTNVKEFVIIDKIREKLDDYVERRANINENNN